MSKILNKLVGKKAKASEPQCEVASPSMSEQRLYKVSAVLNKEKTWNEDLKMYLFVNPIDDKILAVENQNLEFAATDRYWRFTDKLSAGWFDKITLELVK